jgi:hypothetical protein
VVKSRISEDDALEEQLYKLRNEIRKHAHEYCTIRHCIHHEPFKQLLLEANALIDVYYHTVSRTRVRRPDPDEE